MHERTLSLKQGLFRPPNRAEREYQSKVAAVGLMEQKSQTTFFERRKYPTKPSNY
jgi:hypothetical protein